jgi:hypothetical protein
VSRSRESLGIGQQVYAVIEFCNTPEALFGKVDSGKYDWLGVKVAGRRSPANFRRRQPTKSRALARHRHREARRSR